MNQGIKFKLFAMMFLEFFIWGAWLPLIFGYLPSLGFSDFQQSLILNAFPVAAILGMVFSNQFADRNFAAEKFLAVSHLIGGLSMIALTWVQDFWTFFALMLIHCILYVPTISITNSIAFAAMKNAQEEFGIVRMGGTIGWIAASWPTVFILVDWAKVNETAKPGLTGWLDAILDNPLAGSAMQSATAWTYLVAGAASLLLAAFSLTLPHTPPKPAEAGEGGQAWLKAAKLLAHPFVLVLWLVTFIDSLVHNCFFSWTGRFLPTVGIPGNWVMPVMSIGQIAEILTMMVLGMCLKKLGWRKTMVIGILGHAVRFAVFAFCGDPSFKWLIVLVNVLHGVCYAFFFATVYIFVDEHFPKDIRTSAQGLFNVMILGIGSLAANFLCPPLMTQQTEVFASSVDTSKDSQHLEQRVFVQLTPRAGEFKLAYGKKKEDVAVIKNGASAADLQAALEALPSIGSGNVKVEGDLTKGDGAKVTFGGSVAEAQDSKVEQLSIASNVVRFRDLFLMPCLAAAVAALLLALFFHPPKTEAQGDVAALPH